MKTGTNKIKQKEVEANTQELISPSVVFARTLSFQLVYNLFLTNETDSSHTWIANRLSLSAEEVNEAVDWLLTNSYLLRTDTGYKAGVKRVKVTEDVIGIETAYQTSCFNFNHSLTKRLANYNQSFYKTLVFAVSEEKRSELLDEICGLIEKYNDLPPEECTQVTGMYLGINFSGSGEKLDLESKG